MRSALVTSLAVLAFASCVDLSLPPLPAPPGPGSVQGTLVYAVPGRTTAEPAAGARVLLANSALETAAGEDGYFRLEDLATPGGTLLIQFDVDGDGAPDRQRRLDLAAYGAGFGKDVSLGTVLLGRNSTVVGVARRGDLAGQATGHAGTSVFVPEGPFATQTADDGSFLLEAMPEGPLTLAFFRPGYESTVQSTTLRAGERLQLETVLLVVKPTADLPGTLSGTVLQADAAPAQGATISLPGLGAVATTDAEGRFTAQVPAGLYAVTVSKPGFVTVVVPNVLVGSGATAQLGLLLVPAGSGAGGGGGGVGGGGGATGGGGGATGGGGGAGGGGGGGAGGDAGVDDGGAGGGGDAGSGDGGSPDAGPGDAGTDAGGLPVAIIEPHASVYAPYASFLLSGASSTGVQPLVYEWQQTWPTDGGFVFTDYVSGGTNGTRSSFEIRTTTAWWYAERYELQLVVTDALGRASAPATTTFVVSAAPTASIGAVPASVGSGSVFVVSGANSQDTNTYPLPLTQFTWSAVAGSPTLTPNPLLNGREVQVRAPIVAAPSIIRLRLQVTNSLGVTGEVESGDIVVTPLGDAGTWQLTAAAVSSVDAGAFLTVPSLSAVSLRAETQTTIPDAGFTFSWSPQADPDAGWSLSGANTAQASFVAPKVVGATRTLQFTATVNAAAGLIPAQRTSQVTVAVVDDAPPAVASTTFPGGSGSIFGATVTFDEDIEFGAGTYADVLDTSGAQAGVGRVENGRSIVFKPTVPWVVGQTYRVRLRLVYDRSPARNFFPADYSVSYLSFVASLGVSAPFESVDQSAGDPFPGLLLGKTPAPPSDGGAPQPPVLQVFGRRSTTSPGPEAAWFLEPRSAWAFGCPPTPAGSPCALPTLSSAPTPALTPDAGVPIKRSLSGLDAGPVGVLEVRSPSDGGLALLATTSTTGTPALVAQLGAALGPVGVGPNGLVSAGVAADGSLGYSVVDRLTNTWVAESFGPLGGWHPGSELAVVSTATSRVVVGQSAGTQWMRAAWGTSGGWVAADLSSTPTASPRLALKASPAGQAPADEFLVFGLADFTTTTTITHLIARYVQRDTSSLWSAGSYEVLGTTWVTSYDVLHDEGILYVAHVIGEQLRVRAWTWASGFGLTSSTLIPGAHADGVMNGDPACEAAHPELLGAGDFLYLAWQERCPGQNWKLVYRVLH